VFVSDWCDPGVGGHQMGDPDGAGVALSTRASRKQARRREDRSLVNGESGGVRVAESIGLVRGARARRSGLQAVPAATDVAPERSIYEARALWILGGLVDLKGRRARVTRSRSVPGPGLRVARLNGANMLAIGGRCSATSRLRCAARWCSIRDANPALMRRLYIYKDQVQPTVDTTPLQLVRNTTAKTAGISGRRHCGTGKEDALYA
jgi:hypothetical protein